MDKIELAIGRFLLFGTIVSFMIIVFGSLLYLAQHGNDIVNYQVFTGEPKTLTTFLGLWDEVFLFAPRGIIQLGLFTLVIVQIWRVALTVWYFKEIKDKFFASCSLFILFILIGNLIWQF